MHFYSRKHRLRRLDTVANQNPPLKWIISPFMPCRLTTSHLRGGTTAVLYRVILALLHLTVVATAEAAHQTLGISPVKTRAYLATVGSPALRFQEPAPVPPPVVKPIASGPPVAASAPEEAEVSLANDQAAASTPPMPLPDTDSSTIIDPASSPSEPVKSEPTGPKALPILPDDTRRKVQSQDFLPLFRLPGSGGPTEDASVILPGVPTPPAPGTLPPSSATYRVQ